MPDLDRRIATILTGIAVLLATIVALLVMSVALAACKPPEPEHPPTYNPTSCSDACGKARALCGPATLAPRKGGTCEDVCRVTEEGGGDFRTGCLSAAATCGAVHSCSR